MISRCFSSKWRLKDLGCFLPVSPSPLSFSSPGTVVPGNSLQKGKNLEDLVWEVLIDQAWKWHTSLLLTFYWPVPSCMATADLKGGWEL